MQVVLVTIRFAARDRANATKWCSDAHRCSIIDPFLRQFTLLKRVFDLLHLGDQIGRVQDGLWGAASGHHQMNIRRFGRDETKEIAGREESQLATDEDFVENHDVPLTRGNLAGDVFQCRERGLAVDFAGLLIIDNSDKSLPFLAQLDIGGETLDALQLALLP